MSIYFTINASSLWLHEINPILDVCILLHDSQAGSHRKQNEKKCANTAMPHCKSVDSQYDGYVQHYAFKFITPKEKNRRELQL